MTNFKDDTERAKFFGVDKRTIRRWRKAGAPLDSIVEMETWRAQNARTDQHDANRGELGGETPVIYAPGLSEPVDAVKISEKQGMDAHVERLRTFEAILAGRLARALATNSKQAPVLRREWLAISEALRKAEVDRRQIAQDNETSFDREQVIRAFTPMVAGLQKCIAAFGDRLSSKVIGLNYEGTREEVRRECEILIRQFRILGELGIDPRSVSAEDIAELWEEIREVDAGLANYLPPIR